jgi:hypothetical protein
VAAYGHALFGTHWRQRRPCLSVGNLAKTIHLYDRPAMLQVHITPPPPPHMPRHAVAIIT